MVAKRNTIQKQIVFDVLTKMHNHPSAGMVYEAVNAEYPNISRATVFRILAEAADEGKILRLKLNDSTDRYDTTTFHHHIVSRMRSRGRRRYRFRRAKAAGPCSRTRGLLR